MDYLLFPSKIFNDERWLARSCPFAPAYPDASPPVKMSRPRRSQRKRDESLSKLHVSHSCVRRDLLRVSTMWISWTVDSWITCTVNMLLPRILVYNQRHFIGHYPTVSVALLVTLSLWSWLQCSLACFIITIIFFLLPELILHDPRCSVDDLFLVSLWVMVTLQSHVFYHNQRSHVSRLPALSSSRFHLLR